MTDSEMARINAICKVAHIDNIGDLSDGFHTFNDLYYQRCMLFASIVKQNRRKAWKSHKHEDGELCFGGGWFIVGVDTPEGSYTFHYEDKYWDLFDCDELPTGKHWDGHTEKDVTRLFSLPGVYLWKEGSTQTENFEDLKKALIYTIEKTESDNPINLFKELLILLWTDGFAAGQVYALDVEEDY